MFCIVSGVNSAYESKIPCTHMTHNMAFFLHSSTWITNEVAARCNSPPWVITQYY